MTKTRKSKPADARPNRNWVPDGEAVPVGKGSHVYLVDGSAYIFRAFHALPPLTRPSDGLPVGAVHGFCQMLWKLLDESKLADRPTHLAVIFDPSAETFRNEIYSDYKAQRPDPPEELVPQFPLIRDAVVAFNVACIEQAGFEADDLIATYARAADAAGADVTIVSSDKDLMQLVSPGIKMFDGMKNVILGEDEVFEKFGVEPGRVVDVQALAGDSVDNVPGVPGIGIKTAAQLIQEYGDLDTLLARAEEIKQPKRREKLIAFADQARVSRQLVTLKDDVPLEVSAPDIGIQDPVSETLLGFLQEMEFNTLTRRIADAMGVEPPARLEASVGSSVAGKAKAVGRKGATDGTAAKPNGAASNGAGTPQAVVEAMAAKATAVPIDREAYETVVDVDALKTWIGEAREARAFAFDTETSSLDAMQADLVGFSIATAPGRACYVPVGHSASDGGLDFGDGEGLKQLDLRVALAELKPLLEDRAVLKIGQNIKYDALVLRRYGIRVVSFDDTMLLSYALDGGRGGHGMDDLATRHLGHACLPFKQIIALAPGKKIADKTFAGVPIDKATEYAAEDADVTLRLWMILKARIAAERMATVYETLERPLVDVIVDMEEAGISVDRTILSRLSGSFAQRAAALEDEIYELSGETFNLGSPKQLGEILFEEQGLPVKRKTAKGAPSTAEDVLAELAAEFELPEVILNYRSVSKLKSTYTDKLPTLIANDDRVHTSYHQAVAATGRLSSSDPNLQNIPIRTPEGRRIRQAFVPADGYTLLAADYSQIELRIMAHLSGDKGLLDAFANDADVHRATAAEVFGVALDDVTADQRRSAKAINFGLIYGMSAFGLARQLNIGRGEAQTYVDTYFERYPGVHDYMERTRQQAHEDGYVETLHGRRLYLPEIRSRNVQRRQYAERSAINAPMQGTAADIIKRAMIDVHGWLRNSGADARLIMQVHDELVLEVASPNAEDLMQEVVSRMERASTLNVPLKVDASLGANWDEAH